MGNEVAVLQKTEKQAIDFSEFLQSQKRNSLVCDRMSQKIVFSPEIKWQNQLINILETMKGTKNWSQLGDDLIEIIRDIKMQSFIKAISILNAINSHELLCIKLITIVLKTKSVLKQSFLESYRQSRNVFLETDTRYSNIANKQSISTALSIQESDKIKQRKHNGLKKNVSAILIKQINQNYHPFFQIKQSFMMIMQMKYRIRLDSFTSQLTQKERDKIYDQMSKDIEFYTEFIGRGCYVYRKWIIKYSKIKEDRYPQFIKKNILDSLFYGHSFHQLLFGIIREMNEPHISKICDKIKSNISIQKFCVQQDLQIEGAFVRSSILLSDFDKANNPQKILQLLEKLKLQICNDIDLYHQLFKTDKNFKIDGDNFLGILSFLLCKLKNKMVQIYSQIIFLSVVFGDNVNIIFQSASYMITSIQAAFDYLSTNQFLKNIS